MRWLINITMRAASQNLHKFSGWKVKIAESKIRFWQVKVQLCLKYSEVEVVVCWERRRVCF